MTAASIRLRPARSTDKPHVIELTQTIWDGDDYVPGVWDDWLADPYGQLTVAELEGRVVGLGKLTRLAPGEWWLEGLRVDPERQGQGIGQAVHNHQVALWRQIGEPGTLRLFTDSDNQAVHKLCERTGFEKILEATRFKASALPASDPSTLEPVRGDEAERAFAVLSGAPLFADLHGLCDLDWKFGKLTRAFLSERIAAGCAYRWQDWQAVLLVYERADDPDEPKSRERLFIQFAAAPVKPLSELLYDVRALASTRGRRTVEWAVPIRPDLLEQLQTAGFERAWDDSIDLFEARQ